MSSSDAHGDPAFRSTIGSTRDIGRGIPFDVLGEIFEHYVSNDPLDIKQPDTSKGPMLLCQVSSHWRSAALQAPGIWSHLYHVSKVIEEGSGRAIRKTDLEFLQWWRANVRTLAPFFRLALDVSLLPPQSYEIGLGDPTRYAFLVDMMSSAQYLDLDHWWNTALREMLGDRPLDCPRLHNLILRQGHNRKTRCLYEDPPFREEVYDTEKLIPTKPSQTLRRLYIEDLCFRSRTPAHTILLWSQLTHIKTNGLYLTLDTWFSLVRQCTSLVFGDFTINITSPVEVFSSPVDASLPFLRQLAIITFGQGVRVSMLLNLLLPSLTSLRLDIHEPLSIEIINDTLRSTPNLEELQLGSDVPWSYVTHRPCLPGPEETAVTPIWEIAPNLKSIHFGNKVFHDEYLVRQKDLIRSALTSPWLGLERPDNRISCVEFDGAWHDAYYSTETAHILNEVRPLLPAGVEFRVREEDAPLWEIPGEVMKNIIATELSANPNPILFANATNPGPSIMFARSPAAMSSSFQVPRKAILSKEQLEYFQQSQTHKDIVSYIETLNEAVVGVKLTDECSSSPGVIAVLDVLGKVEQIAKDTPPVDNAASRFGNPAFRTFYDKVSEQSSSLHASLPNLPPESISEISVYFNECWGNRTRIDYGSGMELNFLCWLICLERLGVLQESDHKAIVLKVFWRYIQTMRVLQSTYWLEPAGSHGVWGLDDYHFLPFLWGSAQLRGHKYIRPKSIHDPDIVEEYSKHYMYFACIQFINSIKTASLRWHSPMLDDISAVKTWDKVNSGMIKMYLAEVLGKLPVIQHFLFGSILPYDGPETPRSADIQDDAHRGHAHAHGDLGGAGQREVGWGDCCGIPVPSVFAAAQSEKQKGGEFGQGHQLSGPGIRPVPFD